jgi:hypothetical protein
VAGNIPIGVRPDKSQRSRVTSAFTPMIKMPPTNILIAVTLLLAATIASAQHCRKIDIDKSSGFCTVPDPKLTPGKMDSPLVCVSNEDRPRSVTTAEKNAILAAYGYPANTMKSSGEFDHWFPHWMGGSDTAKNIWFEPHAGKFGSLAKDKVERLLWRNVCVNKTMTLDQAKSVYLRGWTKLLSPTLRRFVSAISSQRQPLHRRRPKIEALATICSTKTPS